MSSPEDPRLAAFEYERGEGRTKHRWRNDYAGFVPSGRGPVGKCHRSISEVTARGLLRSGVVAPSPYQDDEEEDAPDEIFNVYRGVPYVAVPTVPGRSYHGYPWRGRMAASVREALRARARDEGTLRTFERWLRKFGEG